MKSTARVVVIGGGIAGCSTLYHLTCEGWHDVVLIERDEITSGTTWHSVAQVTNFGMNQTMVGLKSHSIALYKSLAEDPEYPINYHHADGGIRLANTEEQMEGYRHFASMAKGMGVNFEVIDAAECQRRHPLISTENLLGGLWDPLDGDIDPAQLCQALLRRARAAGAEVYRHTPVINLTQRADDSWIVHTEKGDIECEIVVNAAGLGIIYTQQFADAKAYLFGRSGRDRTAHRGQRIWKACKQPATAHMSHIGKLTHDLKFRNDLFSPLKKNHKTGIRVLISTFTCQ